MKMFHLLSQIKVSELNN